MPQQRLFPVAEENEEDADAYMDISYLGCRFVLWGEGWYVEFWHESISSSLNA
jgi:hypothetical protein